MTSWIVALLKSPSSFEEDPNGYLRNQIGHAYVVGGGLAVLGLPLSLILIGYACWEAVQWFAYKAELWDCFEDAAHVMLIAVAVTYGAWPLAMVQGMFLYSGFLRRQMGV